MTCGNSILEKLPQEIFDLILKKLDKEDGKALRLTSHILKAMSEYSICWKYWMYNRWFFIEDARFNEMRNAELNKIGNYYKYYLQREIEDCQMRFSFEKMASEYDDVSKIQGVWNFVKKFDSELKVIPFLLTYEQENLNIYGLKKERHENFVSQLYLIDMLYRTYRSRFLFEIIGDSFSNTKDYLIEEAYYQISHFDPAFYKIVSFRDSVHRHVCKSVRNYMSNTISSTKEMRLTNIDIVGFIAQEIPKAISVVSKQKLKQPISQPHLITAENPFKSIESLSILRYYCGEIINPSIEMKYAVIQKIASFFGIKITFSRIFLLVDSEVELESPKVLVFKDNKLRNYIQFDSISGEEYLAYIISHYPNRNISALSEMKSWNNVVRYVFSVDAIPYLDTAHVVSRSNPSRVILCRNDILKNVFFHSKMGISEEYWNYIKAYYKLIEISNSERGSGLLGDYNYNKVFLLSLKVRYFADLQALKNYWPKSLILEYFNKTTKNLKNESFQSLGDSGKIDEYFQKLEFKIKDEYIEEFIKTLSLCKYPKYLHPTKEQKLELDNQHRLQLGDCIRYEKFHDSRTVFRGVVVGWSHLYFANNTDVSRQPTMIVQDLIKSFVRNNEVFYNILVYETGTMEIIEDNELHNSNGADSKELIENMGDYYMGLFFKGYDFINNRFIPTSTLERYFATEADD